MKKIKLFLIAGLYAAVFICASCSSHTSNDDDTVSSEGLDRPKVIKNDSITHNDTIVTPIDSNNVKKNNPDITK